ncbi:hypothetical protein HS088_TW13G00547 [Tripterygium wilfordii]|uniref:Uncharacterized protein n=1 Tax=Tripterygium wilfordii TaxID=458696 RepID=A0A7J7CUN0_TRIWF|nr:uncharacterized protein LOC120011719 [Tripterygium wilfordii]KAF5737659.1 hypothetical protein HS088_TW13G00547 [Tripterygium wilfordii]
MNKNCTAHEIKQSKMRRKCRIWWPKQLSSAEPCSFRFLFGWFVSSSPASLDIVVAFASDEPSLSRCGHSGLEDILLETNRSMPTFLQDKSMFTLLGLCAAFPIHDGQRIGAQMEDVQGRCFAHGFASAGSSKDTSRENCGGWTCGCLDVDGLFDNFRQGSIGSSWWIQLVYNPQDNDRGKIYWIPKLHHIHWNGPVITQCDVHVIVYEIPLYGRHHYSLGIWSRSEQMNVPLKKPKWVYQLHKKQNLNDLDSVVLAMNCADAASKTFEGLVGNKTHYTRNPIIHKCLGSLWLILAVSLASLSTLFYIVLQLFHCFLNFGSQTWMYLTAARLFSMTWINMHIRCCQILYWPITLGQKNIRSTSCVENAERAALHKHSMWSSIGFDVILGNLIGMALFANADSASLWVLNFANDFTNSLLRTGCVWLMGVPAGFKLNTELAGVLGMISLNAIQIWSTLWIFVGFLFVYFVKGLAILGILFGLSVPAALAADMIMLTTFHVSALHWLISLLYSHQIQALAALWRLFRGRKWNPLRQRLDSYDYTVKQHIVGSLLFTLLLLLLPTTSVFYIFFTILKTAINFTCVSIEALVSVIHAMPYIKILLQLVNWKRFPLGMWFEILSCQGDSIDSSEYFCVDEISSPSDDSQQNEHTRRKKSTFLVSILHSNFLSMGQVFVPHYRKVVSSVSTSFVPVLAYGVLTGKRIPSSLGTSLPSTMPWMFISFKDYWCLCCNSILSCRADSDSHIFC